MMAAANSANDRACHARLLQRNIRGGFINSAVQAFYVLKNSGPVEEKASAYSSCRIVGARLRVATQAAASLQERPHL